MSNPTPLDLPDPDPSLDPSQPEPAGERSKLRGKHAATRAAIFARPPRTNIRYRDVLALFVALGAEVDESKEGSRAGINLDGLEFVLHKPHPQPELKQYALKAVRKLLMETGR